MRKKEYCCYCGRGLSSKMWEGRVRLFCGHCNLPIYENPIPAACVMVIDKSERILLVKRSVNPKKGMWCLPGGYMELGETPKQTALRELKEETGLDGAVARLFGADSNSSSIYHTVALICYLVKKYKGIPEPGDDACDAQFFHFHKLPEIAFKSHLRFIKNYYS